MGSKRRF